MDANQRKGGDSGGDARRGAGSGSGREKQWLTSLPLHFKFDATILKIWLGHVVDLASRQNGSDTRTQPNVLRIHVRSGVPDLTHKKVFKLKWEGHGNKPKILGH